MRLERIERELRDGAARVRRLSVTSIQNVSSALPSVGDAKASTPSDDPAAHGYVSTTDAARGSGPGSGPQATFAFWMVMVAAIAAWEAKLPVPTVTDQAKAKLKELDELRWSPNGNALMQIDRQTIPYNQFVKDLLLKDQIREIHWKRDGHDRYLVIYNDDRVGYVQVPQDDWITTDLINKQPGLRVHEITEEGERDASTGEYISAGDTSAQLFTQYGVPLIGVGVVWFIVWTMNRFKGDFDDRQKMMEIERREEAMKKVETDISLKLLQQKLDIIDKEKDPEGWNQAKKELDGITHWMPVSYTHLTLPTKA